MCPPKDGATEREGEREGERRPSRERSNSTSTLGTVDSLTTDSSGGSPPASPERRGKCDRVVGSPPGNGRDGSARNERTVLLTRRFLVLVLLLAGTFAFSAGFLSRAIRLSRAASDAEIDGRAAAVETDEARIQLPVPTIIEGKVVPLTTYASKMFAQDGAATSHTVHLDRKDASTDLRIDDSSDDSSDDEGDPDRGVEELHLPAGQHLLVDIRNVDPAFLDSEARLAGAMIDLIDESELTLLSYHCHSLVPAGVSCAGVLLESHVAFHTWPQHGAIAMDLFTCGSGLLIPILPLIRKLFAVPGLPGLEPTVVWSHKLRGFRDDFSPRYDADDNPLEERSDLGGNLGDHGYYMGAMLASEQTRFQRVDVYQNYEDGRHLELHERSLSDDGSYESQNKELYRPEKVLYLDGVEQSSLFGEAAYHEALVHPAMAAHPRPRRVAIIGGGEGATLREVLKHNTVEEVVMVEIDEELVGLCREHLPEWTDCGDNAGSDADSCFDDSRATIVFEDAFRWFEDAFGREAGGGDSDDSSDDSGNSDDSKDDRGGDDTIEKFDIIIMDALDPERTAKIVGNLYKETFVDALFNGLTSKGALVVQMGQSADITEPAFETADEIDKANMINALKMAGFASMHTYDEGHSFFQAPWSYLLSFKDETSRASWYRPAAETDLVLRKRLHRTRSGRSPLLVFDAATMMSYQFPSRAQETKYCRIEDTPRECGEFAGYDPRLVNVPMSHLKAGKSELGEYAGRGLFAARGIPRGGMTDMEMGTRVFHLLPSTWSVTVQLFNWAREWDREWEEYGYVQSELSSVYYFTEGYGYGSTLLGEVHYTVDAAITTFCNHGCNGTFNYAEEGALGSTEMDVSDHPPERLLNRASVVYSPLLERHLRQKLNMGDYALRDIEAGEEVLCNYLSFAQDPDDWKEERMSLRSQCLGETMGQVAGYEHGYSEEEAAALGLSQNWASSS